MFNAIRQVLLIVIVGGGLLLIYNAKSAKKGRWIVAVIVSGVGLVWLSSIFPPENLFVTFDSLESLAKYHGAQEVVYTLEGEDSCYIKYMEDRTDSSVCIAKKVDGGYKIATSHVNNQILNSIKDMMLSESYPTASIYTVRGTQDRFINDTITTDNKEPQLSVVDADGNTVDCEIFSRMIVPDLGQAPYNFEICIYINNKNWSDNLFLVIDGEESPLT